VGAVVFSPRTDLALTGESFDTRAEADLYFSRSQAGRLVRSYLGATDPKNPFASPLYADLSGLPPIRIHVGDAVAAGVDAKLDIWMGMPHGFVTNVGGFNAATQALKASGAFLTERLGARPSENLNKNTRVRLALVTGVFSAGSAPGCAGLARHL
jgi:monoterpene epsilon-lactone hydrolase